MMRLAAGGLIDRSRSVRFAFDGRVYTGHPGDTLASALLANGVRLLGRSFKYHRPRGIMTAGPEDPCALVELRTGARREPNTPATAVELFDGLEAQSQNRFPSLRFDLMAANGWLAPLLAAGFYYKTFMWPAGWWERVYEPLIRRAAGLGRASGLPDPDTYDRAHLFCDVLIIGAGPAGLAAALAAGRSGARVVLCEADARLGGRLLAETCEIDGQPGAAWATSTEATLRAFPELRVLTRTTVFGAYDHGTYAAVERLADHQPFPDAHQPRERVWRIVAKRTVLAAGAVERLVAFPGNDRPGVMLAGAVRCYLNRYAVAPGQTAVVATGGAEGWRTVEALAARGIRVAAVVDRRAEVPPAQAALAQRIGARLFAGARIGATRGATNLRTVIVEGATGGAQRLTADLLAVAGGWNPQVQLACHLGGRPVWDETRAAFLPPTTPPPGMEVAGAAAGRFGLGESLRDGTRAGSDAAVAAGFATTAPEPPSAPDDDTPATPIWLMPGRKAFVDLQHDVTMDDIALAHREGFRAVEHFKRYTTHGMATDQGKTGGVLGMAAMAALTGRSMAETGTTLHRPPSTPVAIGALAGRHRGKDFRPTRLTPGHAWAAEQGASFVESGVWLRAQWFPRAGETEWQQSVDREVLAVRNGVGVSDVSTLGKIELAGPDGGAFLDFLYINMLSTLPVGRVRYGAMLREDGFVLDDGTVARLEAERWVITTTTANAARVLAHMEFAHQVLRPNLRVAFVSVTDRWAQYAVAGKRAREVIQAVLEHAIPDAAFPAMACGTFGSARLFRISFSGELAYEIAVPAREGDALVRRIVAAGAVPYGLEALGVLRIEKGHPAGGELNGQTTARDLGLGRLLSARKDFIGRAMALRPALLDPARPTLVGLRPADRRTRLRAGAHLLPRDAPARIEHDQGWITSAAFSPTLGHPIALALLTNGPARHGERLRAHDPVRDGETEVDVVEPCFVDPEGLRLRG
ncbi:MAG: sarcosine oxidase subunit alpha family protein [Alphaproteobacteria bacterium]|nr:sarcosine oxidase subunit alpha family protein [Alphaproteobacteria bacterium]